MRCSRLVLLLAGAGTLAALVLAPASRAELSDQSALAARFAPVVRLVAQTEACGPGEPYRPLDVDLLFGEPTVALRGPWRPPDLVKIAPDRARISSVASSTTSTFPATRSTLAAATSAGSAG